jgi:aspartate aminotransferase
MEISGRAAQLTPSLTLSIDAKAKAMKAEGIDVCGFGAGEPDFDTPDHIKQAAIAALQSGFTKYTPSSGIPELRQAIAEKLAADNGVNYKATQIIVSNGAKHACYNAILATCQPGDEVIIPAPYWVSYPDMVRLSGAEAVIIPTSERNGWKIRPEDFENAMTPRTKMLILNSPGNPSGSVYTHEELEALVDIAAGEDIYILSDETRQHRVALQRSLRSHIDGQWFQQILRDDWVETWLSGCAGSGGQSGRFYSEPQHREPVFVCAKGSAGRAQRRSTADHRHAR